MPTITTRADFEKLADLRLDDAKKLLAADNWDGAYYMAGYAVECALKVRIVGQVIQSNAFPDRKLTEKFYQHNLQMLLDLAGLKDEMDIDPVLSHWNVVRDWDEKKRYETGKSQQDAALLINAIEIGVLPWIKSRW